MAKEQQSAGLGLLTKAQILGAADVLVEDVEVAEWGGVVRVRGLSGSERDAFEADSILRKGRDVRMNMKNLRARLVAMTVVDEAGERLFGFGDVEALGGKSARALDRVFGVAMRLSGLRDEDVEELAKNFGSDQSDSFISA